jgi:hypothetical protein
LVVFVVLEREIVTHGLLMLERKSLWRRACENIRVLVWAKMRIRAISQVNDGVKQTAIYLARKSNICKRYPQLCSSTMLNSVAYGHIARFGANDT